MNINKHNFTLHYDLLASSIKNCDFIAFDCEFTGIRLSQEFNRFDSIEDLYQKNKEICQNYSLLQLGLSAFRWDSIKKAFVARPFNIYLKKESPNYKSKYYQFFQSESMSFLAEKAFDFKENFLNGLNYERIKDKEKCRERILQKPSNHYGFYLSSKSENTKTQVLKTVEEFMNTANKKKLEVDCETAFLARHLLKNATIEKTLNLEKKLNVELKKGQPSVLKLLKIKQKTTPSKQKEDNNSEENKSDIKVPKPEVEKEVEIKKEEPEIKKDPKEMHFNEYGFSSIMEIIIDAKKPIIGHFPILDILFIYEGFIDELPETYVDFVKEINICFPKIYDTKFMSRKIHSDLEIHNNLEDLYFDIFDGNLKTFHNAVLDEGEGFNRYNVPAFHEGGFDALITGWAFIAMNYFQVFLEKGKDKLSLDYIKNEPFEEKFPLKFVNLLSCRNLNYYSLKQEKIQENLEHVDAFMNNNTFYFEISKAMTLDELGQIFGEWGDVCINLIEEEKNKGFVEYMNFLIEDPEGGFQKITEEIMKKYNTSIKICFYKDRPRFKAKKFRNY